MSLPTGTEPVNETAATSGFSISGRAVPAPPSSTWKTPSGSSGAMISCSSSAVAAAALDGFRIVAFP
jgi:hypothetical protein